MEDPPVFTTLPVYTDAVVGHAWDYVFSFADADFNQTVSASYDGSVSWLSLEDSTIRGPVKSAEVLRFPILELHPQLL